MATETKMDDREVQNRLDFLVSPATTVGPLRPLEQSAGKPIAEFLKEFYDYLFRDPVITPITPITRANGATQDSLEGARAGDARPYLDGYAQTKYVNRRAAVGPPYVRINISPQ